MRTSNYFQKESFSFFIKWTKSIPWLFPEIYGIFLFFLKFSDQFSNSLTFPDFPDSVETLQEKKEMRLNRPLKMNLLEKLFAYYFQLIIIWYHVAMINLFFANFVERKEVSSIRLWSYLFLFFLLLTFQDITLQ